MNTLPAPIVERFAQWAERFKQARFWGIAKTGDGRICLVLPTRVPEFKAVIIDDRDAIVLVVGWSTQGAHQSEIELGSTDTDPGVVFQRACEACLNEAAKSRSPDHRELDFRYQVASVADQIAMHTGDSDSRARAQALIGTHGSPTVP